VLTSLAGGSIVAERFGDGPVTVVGLHGWGRTGGDFAPVFDGLDALAVHLPGFGPAPAPETPWSPADYARWLAAGIDPAYPPVVVGHSFGGRVAVRLAAQHPTLVRGLVLTGVPFGRLSPPKKAPLSLRMAKALKKMGLVSNARVETLRQRHGSADYRASSGVMRDILVTAVNEDYFDDLVRIPHPTRLVWGEGDIPAPVSLARKAQDILPRSTLTVVPGSGHLLDAGLHSALREALRDLVDTDHEKETA
jgi:pimeloyl-ACP methyl ester carboxylesterase